MGFLCYNFNCFGEISNDGYQSAAFLVLIQKQVGAFYASVFGILILHAFCQTHTHIKDRMPKIAPTNTLKEIEAPSQAKQNKIWLAVPYSKSPTLFF